ncbi:MAG: hypothetical protein ACRED0_10125 [Gammaproteobacteria bacterium]
MMMATELEDGAAETLTGALVLSLAYGTDGQAPSWFIEHSAVIKSLLACWQ